jgi:hypothetical protein
MEKILRKKVLLCVCIYALLFPYNSLSQVPTCGFNVPYYEVDLRGKPAGTWTSPSHARLGQCCGVVGSDNCTSFKVLLDSNAVAVNFNIASGAVPSGALYYQIGCGQQVPVGSRICISGQGPHYITFCKLGNNENTYVITSIARPVFPPDKTVRIGCSDKLSVLGITGSSITWNSVYPGSPGQYNSYLSCTNCPNPDFTPDNNTPPYIDYRICGFPIASMCGYNVTVCDTVHVYVAGELSENVTPNPASFCQTGAGSGVMLNAQGSSGNGGYSYIWRNSSSQVVGSGSSFFATTQDIYSVEIRDNLFNAASCPAYFLSVPVTEVPLSVADAGPDQIICANMPKIDLNGNVQNAAGGTWSGGTGTFTPSTGILSATYWPSQNEIDAGGMDLILTTNDVNGCPADRDTIHVTIPSYVAVIIDSGQINCSSSTTILSATASGGGGTYTYSWNTGSTASSVTVPAGNYCVTAKDAMDVYSLHERNITSATEH